MILALPALSALASATGELAVATPTSRHPLLERLPGLRPISPEGLGLHTLYGGADRLPGFETVWLPHAPPLPPARHGVRWYAPPPRRARGAPHATRRYGAALCPGRALPAIRLELTEELLAHGASIVERAGLVPGAFVALHPGAGAPEKVWDGWPEVSRTLPGRLTITGPVERERGDPPSAEPRLLSPTLRDLAAVLAQARAFAGNDSGPGHLAAALGVPTVTTFVDTDPACWAPHDAIALVEPTPEQVLAAIERARRPGPRPRRTSPRSADR